MTITEKLLDTAVSYLSMLRYPAGQPKFYLSSLIIALICYLFFRRTRKPGTRRTILGLLGYCFPRSIYLHRSTKSDLLYLLSFPLVSGLLFAPAFGFSTFLFSFEHTQSALRSVFGTPGEPLVEPLFVYALFLPLSMLAHDFGYYCQHFAMHRVPFLWEFHKVHHSAEVLTPLTDYRVHPVEMLTIPAISGLFVGLSQAMFAHVLAVEMNALVNGAGYSIMLFYFCGYHLRHTHIWVSYGPIASHLLISPAQHQIHHSNDVKHYDKNLGAFFALWDWMFGTLYVPKEKEELEFGLGEEENERYSSPWQLYVMPFVNNFSSRSRRIATTAFVLVLLAFATQRFLKKYVLTEPTLPATPIIPQDHGTDWQVDARVITRYVQ